MSDQDKKIAMAVAGVLVLAGGFVAYKKYSSRDRDSKAKTEQVAIEKETEK
jgi:hypothetical protein